MVEEEAMRVDAKLVSGTFFFLMNLATFALGVWLVVIGLGFVRASGGEGGVKVVIEKVGEITGVNGQSIVFFAGIGISLSAVGYARKAYQEAVKYEGGAKNTIRNFSPLS